RRRVRALRAQQDRANGDAAADRDRARRRLSVRSCPKSRRTIGGNVASELSRTEVKEEGNLLIEAVALLVQRQRETESWVAEQIWQAEERAAATDRRYAELEARLEGIEEHLARLVHEIEPARGDPAGDERLARLREQVEGL